MSKGGGGSPGVVGYRYRMSLLMGLCRGPVDTLVQINANDLPIWTDGDVTENSTISIDKPEIFGGDTKEGGIQGSADIMFGAEDQSTVGSAVEAAIGGRVDAGGTDLPFGGGFDTPPAPTDGPFPPIGGLRGVLTIFYNGLICSNSPYPKAWSFRVRRAKLGWHGGTAWYPDEAQVALDDGFGNQIIAMNGAHILYECLTNPVWGRGLPATALDEISFISAANTMCNEQFGLCMLWDRSVTLQDFMQSVINHIGAALYTDRTTGLITIRLLRKDYEIADLPVFTYSSGLLSIADDTTTSPDNSHSELVVNWTNPITGRPGQTRVQNLAGTQANQTVTSTSIDYLGLPTAALAARVAMRDIQMQGSGIKRYTLVLDRRGRKIAPAGVFVINVPDRNIFNMVLRAGKVEEGPIGSQTIKVTALQDVFGLEATTYLSTPPPTWTAPEKSAMAADIRVVREINYRDTVRALTAAELATVTVDSGDVCVVARAPTGLSTAYDLMTHGSGEAYSIHGTYPWTPSAVTNAALGYYDTSIEIKNGYLLNQVVLPCAAWIDDEVIYVTAYDTGTKTLTIGRGCVDTIPVPHSSNARIWFSDNVMAADGRDYTSGETVNVKLLTKTNTSQLSLDAAPEDTVVIVGRQGLPYPPGDFRLGGNRFAEVDTLVGDVVLTWTHRDRITQMDHVLVHGDGSTGPEDGVTYRTRVYDHTGTLKRTTTGITGDTWTYDTTMQSADTLGNFMTIKLAAQRDGKTSFQEYSWTFFRIDAGYGNSYGARYGG